MAAKPGIRGIPPLGPAPIGNALRHTTPLSTSLKDLLARANQSPRFSILLTILLAINIALNLFWLTARDGLNDLGSFLHSGAAHREGLNPYGYYPWLDPQPISADGLNLNPPVSVYLFDFLGRFDPSLVQTVWMSASVLMVAAAVAALMVAYPQRRTVLVLLAVAALAGFWHLLWYQQIYAPLLLAVTGAWLLMRRGDLLLAGLLIGLVVAIKPNYALVPLLLFAAGHWRVALASAATAASISLVPLVLDGPRIYLQWLELSRGFDGMTWTSNASVMSIGARFGAPLLGQVVAASLLAFVFVMQWRLRPSLLDSTAIGLTTVLLFGPVSWAGYTLLLLPFLFSRRWDAGLWLVILLLAVPFSPERAAAAMGEATSVLLPAATLLGALPSLLPGTSVMLEGVGRLPWGIVGSITASVYAWAVLLLFARLVQERLREHAPLRPSRTLPSPAWRPRDAARALRAAARRAASGERLMRPAPALRRAGAYYAVPVESPRPYEVWGLYVWPRVD